MSTTATDDPMAGSQDLPADPAQATEEASEEQSTDPRNSAIPKLTPHGLPVSESVIEAGTLPAAGFPIDTLEGRVMATAKNPDGTIETESGTLERSQSAHVYQEAGTAEKQREADAKAQAKADKDAAATSSSKS
jgi:hypothetical protein